jgi:hypothetical protein
MFFTLRPSIDNNAHSIIDNSENFISIEVSEPSQLYRYLELCSDLSNNNNNSDFHDIPENFFIKDEINLFKHYRNFSSMIRNAYFGQMNSNSTKIDLFALYLKGQKILYLESKTYCEQYLYSLMLPTIFVSSLCTVLSLALKTFDNAPIIISSLTAFNSFLLALVTYLKLDAKAESHRTTAYQFDKLQNEAEFLSGQVFLIGETDKTIPFITNLEKKVSDIKDTNQFVIPEIIRRRYSNLYSLNIFSLMKQYKTELTILQTELMLLYKEIENKLPDIPKKLLSKRDEILKRIISYRNVSITISKEIYEDINKFESYKNSYNYCMCLRT